MKKYLILSFLFLLAVVPVLARSENANAQAGQTTNSPAKTVTATPTGNQVKNQNEVKTQNEGEDQQLMVSTQENEQLEANDVSDKVSDQVHKLIDTLGAKKGIGDQVREIAQNQEQVQNQIKSEVSELRSRNKFMLFLLGSDEEVVTSLEGKIADNTAMIEKLELLKETTTNKTDLQEIQTTIDLLTYQNESLQNSVDQAKESTGLFGWFARLFRR